MSIGRDRVACELAQSRVMFGYSITPNNRADPNKRAGRKFLFILWNIKKANEDQLPIGV